MRIRQLAAVAVGAAIVAVAGCQSTPPPQPPSTVTNVVPAGPEALLARAQRASGADAAHLYLEAAGAFLAADAPQRAMQALEAVDAAALPPGDRGRYWLMAARLAELEGDFARADVLLAQARTAPQADSYAIAQVASRVCLALGDDDLARYGCAVDQLANATPSEDQLQEVHDLIWQLMSRSPADLGLSLATGANGNAKGWWQLKDKLLKAFSLAEQQSLLAEWRRAWPDHPGNRILPTPVQAIQTGFQGPRHVVLLLPLSGPLASAGRAIRDGFVAAHLHARQALRQSDQSELAPRTISVLDTSQAPIATLLERALLQGADLIVGPLAKERVEQLNALNPMVPVLTLNYLDAHIPVAENVLQLGLAIEDEADTMVDRLVMDNVERVVVFHTYQDWSRRAMKRIEAQWPFPLTVQSFTDIRTITEAVGRAMDIQASQDRRDEIATALGVQLEFLPRARQDVEAIVALVDTLEANALAPALRFHFAEGVPVYASSQTVRAAQAQDLRALDGFRVCELPWLLGKDPLYVSMDDAFGVGGNPLSSLYALGVDAFRVADRAAVLSGNGSQQLLGSTGTLSLHPGGRISRQLAWGMIKDTALVPLVSAWSRR